MTHIGITTSNVRSNPIQHYWPVRRRIAQAAAFLGINFGQEVFPGRRTRAVRRANRRSYAVIWQVQMGLRHKESSGLGYEVPISWPTADWVAGLADQHIIHGGKHRVSEARHIGEQNLIHRRDHAVRVRCLSCHPVSKGYKTGPAARLVSAMPWRRVMLDLYLQRQRELVQKALDDGCTLVITGGDMNHPNPPSPHPRAIQVVGAGLDHLWVVTADGWKVEGVHHTSARRTAAMDHPILHAEFDLVRV